MTDDALDAVFDLNARSVVIGLPRGLACIGGEPRQHH